MENMFLSRIAESLREQHRSLFSWWHAVPRKKRALRLGARAEQAVEEHLVVLEEAIRKAEAKELGKCTICHDQIESHWLETNYTNSVCLEHLSGEERSRLEAELELSQKVQQALLPHAIPDIEGWELAAFSQPASIVGGDYFDFLRFRDQAHALLIADVMGKGMPASMLMASLQASLRILIPESDTPDGVLSRANQLFYHNIRLTKFVSLVLAHVEPGHGLIRYANAGHNPPLLVRRGKLSIVPLPPTGAAIGLVENASFQTASVEAAVDDTLVFYTDGVVEAVDPAGEEFGEERVRELLIRNKEASAAETIKELRTALDEFRGGRPLQDDTTILVSRRTR